MFSPTLVELFVQRPHSLFPSWGFTSPDLWHQTLLPHLQSHRGMDDEKNFIHFFKLFHDLTADTTRIHFSPFFEREIGPAWFIKPLTMLLFAPIIFFGPCFLLDSLVKRKLKPMSVYQMQWLDNLVSVRLSQILSQQMSLRLLLTKLSWQKLLIRLYFLFWKLDALHWFLLLFHPCMDCQKFS